MERKKNPIYVLGLSLPATILLKRLLLPTFVPWSWRCILLVLDLFLRLLEC